MNEFAEILNLFIANVIAYTFFVAVYTEYSCTLDAIKSKLINTHGGYLMVRYTDTGKVLDYLAEFNERSIQSVEYGKNLLDVKISRDHTERITALIPLGAKKKTTDEEGNEVESNERVDITSVNNGLKYILDESTVYKGLHRVTV